MQVACVQAGRRRVPAGRAQCVARQGLRRDGGCHPSDLVQPCTAWREALCTLACTVMHTACPAMHACCACALPPTSAIMRPPSVARWAWCRAIWGTGHSVDGAAPGGSGGTAGRQQWQGGSGCGGARGRVPGKQRRCDTTGHGPWRCFCRPRRAGPRRRRLLLSSSAPPLCPPSRSAAHRVSGAYTTRCFSSAAQLQGSNSGVGALGGRHRGGRREVGSAGARARVLQEVGGRQATVCAQAPMDLTSSQPPQGVAAIATSPLPRPTRCASALLQAPQSGRAILHSLLTCYTCLLLWRAHDRVAARSKGDHGQVRVIKREWHDDERVHENEERAPGHAGGESGQGAPSQVKRSRSHPPLSPP